MVAEFIKRIEPFFTYRQVVYVDVGAYLGEVFSSIAAALPVREAYLFEPNPQSFESLKTSAAEAVRHVRCYNMALGSERTNVTLQPAKSMSKVVDSRAKPVDAVTVECRTLDDMFEEFTIKHISILKIDVEGYELEVLKGAERLLSKQDIDVIYLEIGLDPESAQQTYYRPIEDLLRKHGYRLIEFFEQKNEWIEDSPFLRRANAAFMSSKFAAENPYRLTLELKKAKQESAKARAALEKAECELAKRDEAIRSATARYSEALARASDEHATAMNLASMARTQEADQLHQQLSAAQAEHAATRRLLGDAKQAVARLESKQAALASGTVEALQKELAAAKLKLSTTSGSLEKAQKAQKALTDEVAKAAAYRASVKAGQEQSEKAIAELRKQLAQSTAQLANDEATKSSIARKLVLASSEAEALKKNLRTQEEASSAEIARLRGDLEGLGAKHAKRVGAMRTEIEVARQIAAQQKRLVGETAERIKGQLSYRLGSEVVRGTKTWKGLFKLPGALLRVSKNFDASKAGASAPPSAPSPIGANADKSGPDKSAPRDEAGKQAGTAARPPGEQKKNEGAGAAQRASKLQPDTGRSETGKSGRPAHAGGVNPKPVAANGGSATNAEKSGVATGVKPRSASATAGRPGAALKRTQPSEGPNPAVLRVEHLDRLLWGGYSQQTLDELAAFAKSATNPSIARSTAYYYLARWRYWREEFAEAHALALKSRALRLSPHKGQLILLAQCSLKLGREAETLEFCRTLEKLFGADPDTYLLNAAAVQLAAKNAGATGAAADVPYLEALNRVFTHAGLAALRKFDDDKPLTLSNIFAASSEPAIEATERVSIIMPAYNAADSIGVAISSLQSQTYPNVEIVVVDDCSTDHTCQIVEAFCSRDPRVKLVRQKVNSGAYPARNAGLKSATGDFIMVHDSDDWSHPEKIEAHVRVLRSSPTTQAVMSHWLRVGPDLEVIGPWRPKASLLDLNFSSLLFRKELIERLGHWDEVRVGGDAEFRSRIVAVYGAKAVKNISRNMLLSLALTREDSLTRAKATNRSSLEFGLRWQYRDAYSAWHAEIEKAPKGTSISRPDPRYPVPLANKPRSDKSAPFGIIVLSDFALRDETARNGLECAVAAAREGVRTAVAHLRLFGEDPASVIDPSVYEACLLHGIEMLTAGDDVKAAHVVVANPRLLERLPDSFIRIQAGRHYVLSKDAVDSEALNAKLGALFESVSACTHVPIGADAPNGANGSRNGAAIPGPDDAAKPSTKGFQAEKFLADIGLRTSGPANAKLN